MLAYISELGGQTIAIIGIIGWCISDYQSFAYDKSCVKEFYYERKVPPQSDADYDHDPKNLMRSHINSLSSFSFGYFEYALLSWVKKCVC